MAFLWMGACVAAALICAALRVQRPEMAAAVSLAAGAAVLAAMAAHLDSLFPDMNALRALFLSLGGSSRSAMLRAAGISIVAELAAQVCRDAGERALAGRVALVARVSILALCAPLALELSELLGSFGF